MSLKVAILGANGFIGSRAVEMLHLGCVAEVRPVVRTAQGLASLSRFNLDCRIADARDEMSLSAALEDCDTVVHAVAGDPATILKTITSVYRAAERTGIKRLVYISTASVHGQAPAPGTDENARLCDRQPIAYNNAKVKAERRLIKLRSRSPVELVILRPGIVTGPRSAWISQIATNLSAGTACWLNDGKGICNSIYVDNLVYAIQLALTNSAADGQAFIVADEETVTWADLYRPVAAALGFDVDDIRSASVIMKRRTWNDVLEFLQRNSAIRHLRSRLPRRLRSTLSTALSPLPPPAPCPWAYGEAEHVSPEVPLEMAMLYRCAVKLPDAKARRILGYKPIVTFADGCRRTLGWLAFAGYPLVPDYLSRAANAMNGYSAR
jgi:nucleoside-diphosphate-sugar epimerase